MHVEDGLECDWEGWKIGLQKASAQNLARELMECPANLMTPTKFAQNVVNVLCDSGVNVEVKVRGWAETQQMSAFLAVAKGSCEPPIFLELSYYGAEHNERPIVLVGQGNTFDCGGISLKVNYYLLLIENIKFFFWGILEPRRHALYERRYVRGSCCCIDMPCNRFASIANQSAWVDSTV